VHPILLCLEVDGIIQKHYVFLVNTIDAKDSGLVAELYQAKVLNIPQRDTINAEAISYTQNEKLLSMLSRKTKDQFDKFLDALDNTGQHHVRNQIVGQQGLFIPKTIKSSSARVHNFSFSDA